VSSSKPASVPGQALPDRMLALRLHRVGEPLRAERVDVPSPGPGQVLLQVAACAVCRTDLHVVDGELTDPRLPLVPGHEIVGRVVRTGAGVEGPAIGTRVGVPWLAWTCGACDFCGSGRENLCARARFARLSSGILWLLGVRHGRADRKSTRTVVQIDFLVTREDQIEIAIVVQIGKSRHVSVNFGEAADKGKCAVPVIAIQMAILFGIHRYQIEVSIIIDIRRGGAAVGPVPDPDR